MATPRFYQISLRTILEPVFVAAVVLAFFYWRNVPHNRPGRFQVEAIDNGQVLYLDTATGKLRRGSSYGNSRQKVQAPDVAAKP